MKLYWLYRHHYTERGNRYSPSYYMSKQFEDLGSAGYAGVFDWFIPEDRYTKELAPGIKSLRRFAYVQFDPTKIDEITMKGIVNNVWSMNDIVLFSTKEEAIQWIIENTNLTQIDPNVFEIYPESTDDVTWDVTPAVHLIID